MNARPNILFIVADQLRADALRGALAGCVDTPNLDRLAAAGVAFDRHYTVTVPCGPARASLLTGLYAMNHRVVRNGAPLAAHHATLGHELRRAGYEPLLFGYTDIAVDPAGRHPDDPDLHSYEHVAPGFREIVEMRFDSGFGWPAYLAAQGYPLPRPLPARIRELFRPVAPPDSARAPRITDPALYRAEHSDTAYLTDRTLEQLDARRDRPWFAHVCYIRPHPPLVAPAPYNTLIDPDALPAPLAASPEHPLVALWRDTALQTVPWQGGDGRDCRSLSAADSAALRAVYLGLVAELDRHLGRLFDWLRDTGQWDRTLIVFTADHGDMLGDHGMWDKVNVFEQALRVPLLIRDPDGPSAAGRRVDAPTESVDIAPTLLERLGLAIPAAFDGAALTPWLAGDTPDGWRNAAFAEIDFASAGEPSPYQRAWRLHRDDCNAAVLVERRWKYVHFNGGVPPLLFDLEADPGESVSLADRRERLPALARLARSMLDRRMRRNDRRLTGVSVGV